VRAAYFLSPDLLGKRRLTFQTDGQAIRLTIPRHRSVSAVLLARAGVHLSLDGPAEVLAGQPCKADAVLDNFSGRELLGQWTDGVPEKFTLRPGEPLRRSLAIVAAKGDQPRTQLDCAVELDGRRHGGRFELYVDRPLSADLLVPPVSIPEAAASTIRLAVFNAAGPRTVRVSLAGAQPAEQVVPFAARSRKEVLFHVVPSQPGPLELLARAEAGADRAEVKARVDVHATRASADQLRRVRSGVLILELAGSDHGKYKNKPVFLNNVRLDILPSQGDQWGPTELPLPPAALAKLGPANEVRIENTVGDAFKVRNFQLRLKCDDGLLIVSPLNRQAYTSCSWEFAEGRVFKLHEPLAGIVVQIPKR
jgi:hypothetical protein